MWNWRGMSTIVGVSFGREFLGGPEALDKGGRKIPRKNSLTNSLRNLRAIFRNSPDQHKQFTENPLCRTSGSKIALRIWLPSSLSIRTWRLEVHNLAVIGVHQKRPRAMKDHMICVVLQFPSQTTCHCLPSTSWYFPYHVARISALFSDFPSD